MFQPSLIQTTPQWAQGEVGLTVDTPMYRPLRAGESGDLRERRPESYDLRLSVAEGASMRASSSPGETQYRAGARPADELRKRVGERR